MVFKKFHIFNYLIVSFCANYVWAQGTELDAIREVSNSLNSFALKLLYQTTESAGDDLNLAISPYTVWSLLTLIDEGAKGNTARQLEQVLNIPSNSNKDSFRRSYRSLKKYLLQDDSGTDLDLSSAIFSTITQNLNRNFESIAKTYYGVDVTPTDFSNTARAASTINSYVSKATNDRIKSLVKPDDFENTQIFLVSTLFFKGQWKTPFNRSETHPENFTDTHGNVKGQVKMMYQMGSYPYTLVPQLLAHAIELPYGKGNRFSMIVILPRRNETLSNVLLKLSSIGFSTVLHDLFVAERDYSDEDVQVFLPRFTTFSDLNLNVVLNNMGLKDMFNPQTADLLGMFPHYLAVSRVMQQAKIEVNEEGTVASSAAGAGIGYKSPPPKFIANRGFAYFIVEKPTSSIIFAGKITNPNTI